MRGDRDDDVASGSPRWVGGGGRVPAPALRTAGLVAGFLLAAAATAVVFLTDNPQYLRLAVLAAAWAFVLAAFLAGRRRAEAAAAAAREDEIRRGGYEQELDRAALASREYEHELRREAEESMAAELTALRAELAELSLLKHEVARVARLGTDLPALSGLRAELAGLAGLREDVAQLTALRADVAKLDALRADVAALSALRDDLAQLGELRADVGRLRAELTEQLNGEMLIERIMLRTQSSRAPGEADGPRTVEAPAPWEGDRPPRELTGGWPAVRLDGLTETRQAEHVRVDRPAPNGHPREQAAPRTTAFPLSTPASPRPAPSPASVRPAPAYSPPPTPPTPLEWLADRSLVEPADLQPPHRSRHAAAEPDDVPVPHERSAAVSDLLPPVPPRRRRTDEPFDDRTAERPAAPATSSEPVVRPSPSPRPRPTPAPASPVPVADAGDPVGHQRLAEILADNGVQPATGGRRRRRYRDDDEPDDVLARVLGRNES
ncbi:DUF6779 domain-containing protein [Geodermatophilus sp. SYSU D00691]